MIQSIDRALTILHAVAARDSWVGVREIARLVELKVPTVQNILKTLSGRGYLEFSEEFRGYRIGVAPLLLTEKVDPINRMGDFVRPYLQGLFDRFGETTTCSALFNGKMIVIDSMASAEPLTVIHPHRVVDDPHCLASGQLLLAFAGETLVQAYIAEASFDVGPNLPQSGDELKDALSQIRQQGYAEVVNARNQGIGAVAVPVFGPGGDIAVTLACSAPLVRFDSQKRDTVRRAYADCADIMSKRMGA